ncbi:MAG: SDR family NAD(P)-dependent oxidoreductase [Bacteroidetes bacterium]|nr:SDR family NAD(P)-dependent oxidoreductase [Bacteroidota bacterium]
MSPVADGTLAGRVAMITGASSGIGRALTLMLLREGVHVVATGRNKERLSALREEANGLPGSLLTSVADVTDETQMQRVLDEAAQVYGAPDIVVANAGFGILKPMTEMRTEEFDSVIAANVRGVWLTLRHSLPAMIERGGGDMIIVSSLAGKNGFAGGTAYAASKFAVRGLAQSLMLEVRERNVRVASIFPGSTDTRFFDDTPMSPDREKILAAEDVAQAIVDILRSPRRALLSEIDIRPANPR